MTWTKTKIASSVGIGVLLVAGIIALGLWLGNPRKRAEAKGERLLKNLAARSVTLTNNYQSFVDNRVPSGFHTFNNVPLQINVMMRLWGEGAASKGMLHPKEVLDIPVYQKFETLYVYHGSAYGSPPGTPVCEVVLRFVNGTSVTNRLIYGDDMLDWFSPGGINVKGPSGPNSKLAWIGQMPGQNGGTQQLRYCMTAIANPTPALAVSTIDLYSCKSRTVACIMAMTTGKAGLMNDALPTDDRK
jgi:hypothetical protein